MNIPKTWIFILVVISFMIYAVATPALTNRFDDGNLPTKIVEVANPQSRLPATKILLPDWNRISLSQLPGIGQSGAIDGSPYSQALGYDLSRTWNVGMTPDQYLKLGDISEAFQAEEFSLQAIALRAHPQAIALRTWTETTDELDSIDLNKIPLSEFPLIGEQTLSHLAEVVPELAQTSVKDITPVAKLLQSQGIAASNLTLAQVLTQYEVGQRKLEEIDLSQFAITAIPNVDAVQIKELSNWMNSFVKNIPGLGAVPLALMPNPITKIGNLVMRIDAVYGRAENRRNRTISGSDVQGFSVPCTQRDCAYLELDDLENAGRGERSLLEGKQWISGKYQEVEGGWGILKAVNNGREPTGRLPFGKAFKVVVMEPDETTDTVDTALFLRFCAWQMGCTPYFIGPIPFFSYKVNALMFVGNLDSGSQSSSQTTSIPTGAKTQVSSNSAENGTGTNQMNPCNFTSPHGSMSSQSGDGINLRSLGNAIAKIESAGSGDDKAIGVYTCADQGLNCGRALGRYQFMSYNPYAVELIVAKPGGQEFLSRVEQGYKPTEAELFQFFPRADQEQAFLADMADKIEVTQAEIDPTTGEHFTGDGQSPASGDRLIERVAQKHFGGNYSLIDGGGSDAFGRLSLKDYGKTALATYRHSHDHNQTLTCVPSGQRFAFN
ncbi:M23 family peptidase [Nodularia spumigena]|uniref:M23 family peptidase n=2 Tax=Nodularia spumigena TaxID=70799 RepID=A0ABU5UUR6_NODSP|nr:M23 family peptidase [Nodularia spumigena]MEA5527457.1 M23 family peptidase [Nodularia spumigena UHCC 0143]MEA5610001.1 M23 family peptidase [Nodularia spumigena UHCC 0060]MEA5613533.1 M23 family peptidase [Nodularia spumigena UHCC 0040]